jgi:DNA polymerase-3 subunit epsilon
MYALVDIETTGGYAANNGITELAIVLHDGKKQISRFETLVNPLVPIPPYIRALTGITDEMVQDAPTFEEVSSELHSLLEGNVFVAHNVNFDYSFLKFHLESCGFELQVKKLCTVRLSRKVFPGLTGYSLGKLCRQLGIPVSNRHRAGGDLDATVLLFERILAADGEGHLQNMLKGRGREQYLPPNLPSEQLDRIPERAGIYYFHDQKGKVIYVGKAKNLLRRVSSHFANNKPNLQKQEFLRSIHSISWETCGTELMAFLLECVEIRRLWPRYNRSLKRFEQQYGLYVFEDRRGYLRLAIEKKKKIFPEAFSFSLLTEGHSMLRKLIRDFGLCPRLCFLQTDEDPCKGMQENTCQGACQGLEHPTAYNVRVQNALDRLKVSLPSFTLLDEGRNPREKSCILMEDGKFYGMGYLPADSTILDTEELKNHLTAYPENEYMRGLIYQHAARWPHKKFQLSTSGAR